MAIVFALFSAVIVLILVSCRSYIILSTRGSIYRMTQLPKAPYAIVFGAGLREDGTSTLVLSDRIKTSVLLYSAGIVKMLYMSGYEYANGFNETTEMQRIALLSGVPADVIVLDPFGNRTFTTCKNAINQHHIHSAVLVTQRFHLPRALFIARKLGIQVTGISADLHRYNRFSQLLWDLREYPACISAVFDCLFYRSG